MEATDGKILDRLQSKVDAVRAKTCSVCAGSLCGHEILFSIAMGLADKPQCANCLAHGLGTTMRQLRDHLRAHFRQRECYGEVWRRENEREGFAGDSLPGCLWPESELPYEVVKKLGQVPSKYAKSSQNTNIHSEPVPFFHSLYAKHAFVETEVTVKPLEEADVIGLAVEAWDAGDMACGDLVLALRVRMNALAAGTRLKLTARDTGATEDIPAWCRMTGHLLLAQQHPYYWIQRKE